MLEEEDFTSLIEDMTNGDLNLLVPALRVLLTHPTGDKRLLPYLKNFLDDQRPCLVATPFLFAEVRWLAAHALAAELKQLGIQELIHLEHVVRPIPFQPLADLAKAAKVKTGPGLEGSLERFAILQQRGLLPTYTLTL